MKGGGHGCRDWGRPLASATTSTATTMGEPKASEKVVGQDAGKVADAACTAGTGSYNAGVGEGEGEGGGVPFTDDAAGTRWF